MPGPLPSCTASPRQRATVVIGALAGVAALAGAVLAGALTYLHVVAVSSLAGAVPIWLAITLLYAAAGATVWSTRHTLGQHHPQAPVWCASARWPPGPRATERACTTSVGNCAHWPTPNRSPSTWSPAPPTSSTTTPGSASPNPNRAGRGWSTSQPASLGAPLNPGAATGWR